MALRLRYNSPVILTFAIACTVLYFFNDLTKGSLNSVLILQGHFDGTSIGSYLSLVMYTLGHQDVNHLLGNMSFILLLGPIVEEKYGSLSVFIMMLFTALITGIMHIVFLNTGLLGASGIVFMLIILVSFTNIERGGIPITFLLIVALFIGKEIVASMKPDQVSQFAHIVGGVFGSIFGFIVRKRPLQDINSGR